MATDSTESGYLVPSSQPIYDDALDDLLHDVVQGITGLSNQLIRPRWQPEPPNQPAFDVNWCAVGVSHWERDLNPHVQPLTDGTGSRLEKDEIAHVILSFYGPRGAEYATMFCDGLAINQNRDALTAAQIGLVSISEPRNLPALLKEKWVRRADVTIRLRRRMTRIYSVRTVLSAGVDLNNEQYHTPINVNP